MGEISTSELENKMKKVYEDHDKKASRGEHKPDKKIGKVDFELVSEEKMNELKADIKKDFLEIRPIANKIINSIDARIRNNLKFTNEEKTRLRSVLSDYISLSFQLMKMGIITNNEAQAVKQENGKLVSTKDALESIPPYTVINMGEITDIKIVY